MNFFRILQNSANPLLKGAWATMGIPFDLPMVNEKKEGMIDVEALIIATLLIMTQGRIITDLPAWLIRFSELLNHQKLKSLFNGMQQVHRTLVLKNLNQGPLCGAPMPFKKIFKLERQPTSDIADIIGARLRKLNSIENVAQSSIMLYNRLLYGTGFRADLVTLTHIKGIGVKGSQLAKLLCSNASTVSRILNDLKACGFLDHDSERVGRFVSYPRMFISTQSLWNLCGMIDASKFKSDELRKATLENLHFKQDEFCRQIVMRTA